MPLCCKWRPAVVGAGRSGSSVRRSFILVSPSGISSLCQFETMFIYVLHRPHLPFEGGTFVLSSKGGLSSKRRRVSALIFQAGRSCAKRNNDLARPVAELLQATFSGGRLPGRNAPEPFLPNVAVRRRSRVRKGTLPITVQTAQKGSVSFARRY